MSDAILDIVRTEWREVLGVASVESDDDFFASGGDSMSAMMLLARIEHKLDIELPFDIFFVDGTCRGLAAACTDAANPAVTNQDG